MSMMGFLWRTQLQWPVGASWRHRALTAEARLQNLAYHTARLAGRSDLSDEEMLKKFLAFESDLVTYQTDCTNCSAMWDKLFQMDMRRHDLYVALQAIQKRWNNNGGDVGLMATIALQSDDQCDVSDGA